VYDTDGPLESMDDDIIVRTDRGVREVMTEEFGKRIPLLLGYHCKRLAADYWGT
jgi:hypothetical protein